MGHPEHAAADARNGSDDADIEIRMRADLAHLPVVRAVAANIALRADFDLDAVEDVKLAVDEMCSTLIMRARPDAMLTCGFQVVDEQIRIRAEVTSDSSEPVDELSFGWRVLNTLADTVSTRISPRHDQQSGFLVRMEIAKAPGEATAG